MRLLISGNNTTVQLQTSNILISKNSKKNFLQNILFPFWRWKQKGCRIVQIFNGLSNNSKYQFVSRSKERTIKLNFLLTISYKKNERIFANSIMFWVSPHSINKSQFTWEWNQEGREGGGGDINIFCLLFCLLLNVKYAKHYLLALNQLVHEPHIIKQIAYVRVVQMQVCQYDTNKNSILFPFLSDIFWSLPILLAL